MANYICYLILIGIQQPFFYEEDDFGQKYLRHRAYLAVCCVELILLAGLRGYTVGADTATYLQAIDFYENLSFLELIKVKRMPPYAFEVGYFLLSKLCVGLSLGKTGFLFVIACLTYIPVFRAISKYSEIPYISILCYFGFGMFSYSLGIFRQMIAISILLCGWRYVVERQLIKYLFVVVLATSFHSTAIVAVALYILYGIKWERIIWLLPSVEAGLLILGRPIIMFATKMLPQYARYIGSEYDLNGGSYKMLLLLNMILIVSVLCRCQNLSRDNLIISALILAVCIQAIGYSMAIFGRMVPYFSIYSIFAIPNSVKRIDKISRPFFVIATVSALFVLVYMEFNGNQYVTPYYTIL